MRAIKKPIPIEVEEFQPDRLPWPNGVAQNSDPDNFNSPMYQVWNDLHGSWITIQPGDYINVTDETGRDIYPIDRETFERTYDVIKTLAVVLAFLLWSAVAFAQPNCLTVMLPDLGPLGETSVTGGIATGFLVPPASTQPAGAFYPFALFSEANGNVGIDQYDVGVNTKRRWTKVSSISLVYWLSFNDPLLPLVYTGYKTLVNSVPLGMFPLPTWAYRIVERFAQPIESHNLSKPVQLGEVYSVGITNPLPYPVWANLQIEARICR